MNRCRAQVRFLAGALHALRSPQIGLLGTRGELVLHLKRDVERERRHQLHQQLTDRTVDSGAGDALAPGARRLDTFAAAHILGILSPLASVVTHRHAPAAHAASGQTLQQRRSLARGAAALRFVGLGIVPELAFIRLEPLPGDVARVGSRSSTVHSSRGTLLVSTPPPGRRRLRLRPYT